MFLTVVTLVSLFPFPLLGAVVLAERVTHPESKALR